MKSWILYVRLQMKDTFVSISSFKFILPFFAISLDLERRDKDGHVVLWFAILSTKSNLEDDPDSNYAAKLVKRGSSADAVNPLTGSKIQVLILYFHEFDVFYYFYIHGSCRHCTP